MLNTVLLSAVLLTYGKIWNSMFTFLILISKVEKYDMEGFFHLRKCVGINFTAIVLIGYDYHHTVFLY